MKIYNFLADIPWYIPAVLFLVAAVLLYTGNARRDRPLLRAGAVAILIAIVLTLLSWLLVSDREMVLRNTRHLVKAVELRDWRRMEGYFHPRASIYVFKGRDAVVNATRLGVERIDLQSASVSGLSVRPNDEGMIASLQVWSDSKVTSTVLTNWEIYWEKVDGKWQITETRAMGGPGMSEGDLEAWISRGK